MSFFSRFDLLSRRGSDSPSEASTAGPGSSKATATTETTETETQTTQLLDVVGTTPSPSHIRNNGATSPRTLYAVTPYNKSNNSNNSNTMTTGGMQTPFVTLLDTDITITSRRGGNRYEFSKGNRVFEEKSKEYWAKHAVDDGLSRGEAIEEFMDWLLQNHRIVKETTTTGGGGGGGGKMRTRWEICKDRRRIKEKINQRFKHLKRLAARK